MFEQEYLARFLEDGGGVFRGVMAAATAEEQAQAVDGHEYVFGVDWAQSQDFTVIAVIDVTTQELVALDRFNQIDYQLQVNRLETLFQMFNPGDIVAERNSIGQPLVERLHDMGLPVSPFLTTNASKNELIRNLVLGIERQTLKILPDPVLVNELQAFEQTRLASGLMRFEAPEGMHDDTVIALALAWYGAVGVYGGPAVLEL